LGQPKAKFRFQITPASLEIYSSDGQPFLTYSELAQQLQQERDRVLALEAKLREMGVDPNQIEPML
jgi:hypothetical protein